MFAELTGEQIEFVCGAVKAAAGFSGGRPRPVPLMRTLIVGAGAQGRVDRRHPPRIGAATTPSPSSTRMKASGAPK